MKEIARIISNVIVVLGIISGIILVLKYNDMKNNYELERSFNDTSMNKAEIVVSNIDIKEGSIIDESMIRKVKCLDLGSDDAKGINVIYVDNIIGTESKIDIDKDEILSSSMFKKTPNDKEDSSIYIDNILNIDAVEVLSRVDVYVKEGDKEFKLLENKEVLEKIEGKVKLKVYEEERNIIERFLLGLNENEYLYIRPYKNIDIEETKIIYGNE